MPVKKTEQYTIIHFNICARILFLKSGVKGTITVDELFPAVTAWKNEYKKATGLDFAVETKKAMDKLCLGERDGNAYFTKERVDGVTYYQCTDLAKLERLYELLYKELSEGRGMINFRGYDIIPTILESIDIEESYTRFYTVLF